MKIQAIGCRKSKRATRIVIEAEGEIDEAVLYEKFADLYKNPPVLQPWYQDVLKHFESGASSAYEIADFLGIAGTACNNRIAYLFRLNLVNRRAENIASGGRSFVYWLNRRGPNEAPPSDVLDGDDL